MGPCLSKADGAGGGGAAGGGGPPKVLTDPVFSGLLMRIHEAASAARVMRLDCRDLDRHVRVVEEALSANSAKIQKKREGRDEPAVLNLELALRDTCDFMESFAQRSLLDPGHLAPLIGSASSQSGSLVGRLQLATGVLNLSLEAGLSTKVKGLAEDARGDFQQEAALSELLASVGGAAVVSKSEEMLAAVGAVGIAWDVPSLEKAKAHAAEIARKAGGKEEVTSLGVSIEAIGLEEAPVATPTLTPPASTFKSGEDASGKGGGKVDNAGGAQSSSSSPWRSLGNVARAGGDGSPQVPHNAWDFGISAVEPGAIIASSSEGGSEPPPATTLPHGEGEQRPQQQQQEEEVAAPSGAEGLRRAAELVASASGRRVEDLEAEAAEFDALAPMPHAKPRPPSSTPGHVGAGKGASASAENLLAARAGLVGGRWDGYERQVQEVGDGTPTSISMEEIELSPESIIGHHYAPSTPTSASQSWGSNTMHLSPHAVNALLRLPRHGSQKKEGGGAGGGEGSTPPPPPTNMGPANTWAAGDVGISAREYARLLQAVPKPAARSAAARRQRAAALSAQQHAFNMSRGVGGADDAAPAAGAEAAAAGTAPEVAVVKTAEQLSAEKAHEVAQKEASGARKKASLFKKLIHNSL